MAPNTARKLAGRRSTRAAAIAVSRFLLTSFTAAQVSPVLGNPQGMTVGSGTVSATQNGSQLNVSASHNAFINWRSFNIGAGETTTFLQPSASSMVWNQINDRNPSQIWGNLNANGTVVLMNQSGFFFGPNSKINAAGFVATTAVPHVASSGAWEFDGPPPSVPIINYGAIRVQSGGSLFLIADAIENHGTLSAPDGTLGLYAGKNVLISNRPDGGGISVATTLPSGSVDNWGRLIADGGSILLNAQTVNQNGLIQANSVQNRNGVIELIASDAVNLGDTSQIIARGDDTTLISAGGNVTIKSGNIFSDSIGSQIITSGGALGGNGGNMEVSAPAILSLDSSMDASAQPGWLGGHFLLDPDNITLGNSGTGTVPNNGTVAYDSGSGTLLLNVSTTFANKNFSVIDLQAKHTITLNAGTIWNLAQSTGQSGPGCKLTLEVGDLPVVRDSTGKVTDTGSEIIIGNGASIAGGNGWSVIMKAGRDFNTLDTITPGMGNITFNGTGGLQTQNGAASLIAGNNITFSGTGGLQAQSGSISLLAGNNITFSTSGSLQTQSGAISLLANNNITLNTGYIRTVNGGNIDATAVAGNINTGTKANGFSFLQTGTGYSVDPNLGGISTSAGGNVNLTAGNDIISFLPTSTTPGNDAGSGAFGPQAGNVTLTAGHDVIGHYVVANGTGTLNAGHNAGNNTKMLALSLIAGGWTVKAGQDIMLQEVRNPNGIFNSFGFSTSTTKHYFDYAPNDFVNLSAGNSVQLLGASLPRTADQAIPLIFPSTLNIRAGAGGILIPNDFILFPSPVGELTITTFAGGSLMGTKPGDLVRIIISDSSASQFTSADSFGADDRAAIPIHLNDPQAVSLNIAGDMSNIQLISPKKTDITIGGNMVNSRLQIQNLHPTDVSSLNVAHDIVNRNEFTSVVLDTAPDFNVFALAYPPLTDTLATLSSLFHYDEKTKTLTFQGRMSGNALQALLDLQVLTLDPLGNPIPGADGKPVTHPADFISDASLQQLFDDSQDIPLNPNTGYLIAGPGAFNVNAHSMDLGATKGIQSIGPANNPALALLGNSGAAINVNLTGDLNMFSTTISSLGGGDINVFAHGDVNAGSTQFSGNDANARGIFTVAKSDVTVVADGDINVNGSRIGAYDGGNVNVVSLHGNVNAGSGGAGVATVQEVLVNPLTGEIQIYAPTIPGSGILATTFPPPLDPTFPPSHNAVGNIVVSTPEGNIVASGGGIIQLPLNGANSSDASVTLIAGTKDASGKVIHVGNIDATGSGVIGANVILDASGDITGFIVAQHNLNVTATANVNVTAVAAGDASVSAGGGISGTIVGIGSVTASGASVDASLLSQNVSASGNTSGAQMGFAQANAAGTTSQSAQSETPDAVKAVASNDTGDADDKKKKRQTLTRQSRVTVVLPNKS